MKSLLKSVKSQCLLLILSTAICVPFKAIAAGDTGTGGGSTGGGDLECDAKIKDITRNLRDWFAQNGPQKDSILDLSSSLNPFTQKPFTKEEYTAAMSSLMTKPLRSACTHRQNTSDPAPVIVGNTPKICRTFLSGGVIDMLCDSDILLNMKRDNLKNQDLQIQQIHHEFAILVKGLEPDVASLPSLKPFTIDISSYRISSQLAKVTETVSVRQVMVIDPATSAVNYSNTFAGKLSFLNTDQAIAQKGGERLFLYQGKSIYQESPCWTMIQVEGSGSNAKVIGAGNVAFSYYKANLIQRGLKFSFVQNFDQQFQFNVSEDSYELKLNLNSEGRLSSSMVNTRIPKLKELWYGLNSETHNEYHDVACVNLKNIRDLSGLSDGFKEIVQKDIQLFLK